LRVRIVSQPPERRTRNAGSGSRARVAVIVGRSSKRASCAYSSRISVGVSTSKRAAPARTIGERPAAEALAANASINAAAKNRNPPRQRMRGRYPLRGLPTPAFPRHRLKPLRRWAPGRVIGEALEH
jgi:hypothetical protein